jgi:hypothetical protein
MKTQSDALAAAPQLKKRPRKNLEAKGKRNKTRNAAFNNPFEEALRKKRR